MTMIELMLKQLGIDPVALTSQFKEVITEFQEEHRKLQHITLSTHDMLLATHDMLLRVSSRQVSMENRLERMEIVLLNLASGEGSSYAEMDPASYQTPVCLPFPEKTNGVISILSFTHSNEED